MIILKIVFPTTLCTSFFYCHVLLNLLTLQTNSLFNFRHISRNPFIIWDHFLKSFHCSRIYNMKFTIWTIFTCTVPVALSMLTVLHNHLSRTLFTLQNWYSIVIIFHFNYRTYFAYPFIYWWTFGLFLPSDYCEIMLLWTPL